MAKDFDGTLTPIDNTNKQILSELSSIKKMMSTFGMEKPINKQIKDDKVKDQKSDSNDKKEDSQKKSLDKTVDPIKKSLSESFTNVTDTIYGGTVFGSALKGIKNLASKVPLKPNANLLASRGDAGSLFIANKLEELMGTKNKDDKGSILKTLLGGMTVAGAGIAVLVSGLIDDGPFKGLKKIVGKFFTKIGAFLIESFFKKIVKFIPDMFKPILQFFPNLIKNFGDKIGKKLFGEVAETGIKKVLQGLLKKVGPKLAKGLKFVPIIGSLISFAFAISRFKSGDIFGGIVEIASGIADLIPGVGSVISTGLDVFLMLRDMGKFQGVGEKIKTGAVNIANIIVPAVKKFFINHVAPKLNMVPGIGTIIRLGEAIQLFKSGNVIDGLLRLGSSFALFVPGLGQLIAFATDLLTNRGKARENVTKSVNTGGMIFKTIQKFFVSKGLPLLNTVKDIIKGVIQSAFSVVKNVVLNKIPALASSAVSGILNFFSSGINTIAGIGETIGMGIRSIAINVFNTIKNIISDPVQFVENVKQGFFNFIDTAFNVVRNGIQAISSFKDRITNSIMDNIITPISNFFSGFQDFFSFIGGFVTNPIEMIQNLRGKGIGEAFSDFRAQKQRERDLASTSDYSSLGTTTASDMAARGMRVTSVEDAIIKSDGSVIRTSPDDNLIATKNQIQSVGTTNISNEKLDILISSINTLIDVTKANRPVSDEIGQLRNLLVED